MPFQLPDWRCDESDDFARIEVLQDWSGPNGSTPIMISSFEHTYVDAILNQTYHSVSGNGLDGRVKLVYVISPSSTTTTISPDDNGSRRAMGLSTTLAEATLILTASLLSSL